MRENGEPSFTPAKSKFLSNLTNNHAPLCQKGTIKKLIPKKRIYSGKIFGKNQKSKKNPEHRFDVPDKDFKLFLLEDIENALESFNDALEEV